MDNYDFQPCLQKCDAMPKSALYGVICSLRRTDMNPLTSLKASVFIICDISCHINSMSIVVLLQCLGNNEEEKSTRSVQMQLFLDDFTSGTGCINGCEHSGTEG